MLKWNEACINKFLIFVSFICSIAIYYISTEEQQFAYVGFSVMFTPMLMQAM